MKKIIFLAPFPTSENIKEGMMQRVYAVDKMFGNNEYEKTYIIPKFNTFKTEYKEVGNNVIELHLSVWVSFSLLLKKIMNADAVYSHSLYGMTLAGLLYLPLINLSNFIWDVHGIIPEELKLARLSKLKQFVYSLLERVAVCKATKIIVVTNAMKNHLYKKYKNIKAEFLVYPILPMTINIENGFEEQGDKIIILYSGNTQGYQNITLMVDCIKKLVNTPNVFFYILTGQKDEMEVIFKSNGLDKKDNIFVETVLPTELDSYYKKAHYGFVLRDDVDVNNVACPTKIIEYLAYGMTCITLNSKIGDFEDLGFEYMTIEQLNAQNLSSKKSLINHQIYIKLFESCKTDDVLNFVQK